jgi:putative aldouronate transport system permease protein
MAILPCLHVVSKAFSLGTRVTAGQVLFWPNGFQLETIRYVLTKTSFFTASRTR